MLVGFRPTRFWTWLWGILCAMADRPQETNTDRLRRIRDMLLGREPSLLTEVKTAIAAMEAQLDRIETTLNETKATTLGGTYAEIPKQPKPPTTP